MGRVSLNPAQEARFSRCPLFLGMGRMAALPRAKVTN
jgi:hypothetical protein